MPDPKLRVRIRMYRPGLGDCFLLTFARDNKESHILIDCGIFVGTTNEREWIRKIAEDIKEVTNGKLDAVVATHEHWDHVAGFHYAKDIFDGENNIIIDEVWLAWTEDPDQQVVKERRKQKEKLAVDLGKSVHQLIGFGSLWEQECGRAIADVLAFNGPVTDDEPFSLDEPFAIDGPAAKLFAAFSKRSNAAMEHLLKLKTRKGSKDFLKPGDLFRPSWLEEVRVYVLGPPENLDFLGEMEGSRETEQYLDDRQVTEAVSQNWQSGVSQFCIKTGKYHIPESKETVLEEADSEEAALEKPVPGLSFEDIARVEAEIKEAERLEAENIKAEQKKVERQEAFEREEAERHETFNRVHRWTEAELLAEGGETAAMIASYRSEDWRRIDSAWFNHASRLALQLDKATNNTSLVLAFEIISSGQVLLFVGDAQIGNWQSWEKLSWEIPENQVDKRKVSIKDLLERTIFYKVGHHGSINATRKEGGLELMTSPHLVAAIPTDREFSNNQKGWDMPAKNIEKALLEKTRGRLLLSDSRAHPDNSQGLSELTWQSFISRIKEEKNQMFVDYWIET